MNKIDYISKLKSLRNIISYNLSPKEELYREFVDEGYKITDIISYMLKDRYLSEKHININSALAVKDLVSYAKRLTPEHLEERVNYYFTKSQNTYDPKSRGLKEKERKDKILYYISKYKDLKNKIDKTKSDMVKALGLKGKYDDSVKGQAKMLEEIKSKENFYLKLSVISGIVSIIAVLMFSSSAYQEIKTAFKEIFNSNNTLGQKLIHVIKGIAWCSLIVFPIALTIYFISMYNNMRIAATTVSDKEFKDSGTKMNTVIEVLQKTLYDLEKSMEELENSTKVLTNIKGVN